MFGVQLLGVLREGGISADIGMLERDAGTLANFFMPGPAATDASSYRIVPLHEVLDKRQAAEGFQVSALHMLVNPMAIGLLAPSELRAVEEQRARDLGLKYFVHASRGVFETELLIVFASEVLTRSGLVEEETEPSREELKQDLRRLMVALSWTIGSRLYLAEPRKGVRTVPDEGVCNALLARMRERGHEVKRDTRGGADLVEGHFAFGETVDHVATAVGLLQRYLGLEGCARVRMELTESRFYFGDSGLLEKGAFGEVDHRVELLYPDPPDRSDNGHSKKNGSQGSGGMVIPFRRRQRNK